METECDKEANATEMEIVKTEVLEDAYEGFNFSEIITSDNAKIYQFENESGKGEMRCYNLLDGIQLTYNHLNMATAYQKIEPKEGILQIDYCLDGCYAFELANKEHAFIGKGDLSILDFGKSQFENSCIPTKKYVGLTIFININAAQNSICKFFPWGNIDLKKLRDELCQEGAALIIHSRKEINRIIHELYEVPKEIQISYSIVKILELLLFLGLAEKTDTKPLSSFSEIVYTATQKCYQAILDHPFEKYSISELANLYTISESSLKRCFAAMTGNSIGNFKKNVCLDASSELLIHKPEMSIGEVSEIAGYLNQGKYTAAFKAHFGETPQQYRKHHLT